MDSDDSSSTPCVSSNSNSSIGEFTESDQSDVVLRALSNPVILQTIFKYLNLSSLKSANNVCLKWSRIIHPLRHPATVVYLRDQRVIEDQPPRLTVQKKLNELEKGWINVPGGIQYKVGLTSSKLVQILDTIKDSVSYLELSIDRYEYARLEDGKLSSIQFPYLKTISLEFLMGKDFDNFDDDGDDDVDDELDDHDEAETILNTFLLIEIINRTPNLTELRVSWDVEELPRIFFEILFGKDGVQDNTRLRNTLTSLTITSIEFDNDGIEAIRVMKLRLKHLTLVLRGFKITEDPVFLFPSLMLWLEDMRLTLETLSLSLICGSNAHVIQFKMPTPLIKLKRLDMIRPESFGTITLLPLLDIIPNVEVLILKKADSTGVKIGNWNTIITDHTRFNNVGELLIFTHVFNELDCSPSIYCPRLFPQLRKLSMCLYSRKCLLECMIGLKDMQIEELNLKLKSVKRMIEWTADDDEEHESHFFNNWSWLRKLVINNHIKSPLCLMDVYGIPILDFIPKRLTSLAMRHGELRVDFEPIKELMRGLPLLLEFQLCDILVNDESGNDMRLSKIQRAIGNDHLINPNLYFTMTSGGHIYL